jgi:two-component system, cell cycle sensor histidine kinase and response regulator CckA
MFPTGPMLVGSYDHRLVALSVVIAICASYAALDLAGRVTAAKGHTRVAWLTGGAAAMGLGIWSMHYIGMLAFTLPVPVSYDWPTVLVSLLAAILASAVALYVVSRNRMGAWRAVAGSIMMGAGIATMHYTGMAAMRLAGMCHFSISLVALSVFLAIVISYVALWLAFLAREEKKDAFIRKITCAIVMGAAIPVMHYTGMAAASFTVSNMVPDLSHAVGISTIGTGGIAIVTIIVLGITILTSVFDRRYSAQSLELESAEERYRLLFERSLAGVLRSTLEGSILDCNDACARIFGFATRTQLIGSSMTDRYGDAKDRDAFIAKLKEAKDLANYEHLLRRKDGSPVWLLGSAHLNDSTNGEPAVYEETLIDITERRDAEETFRKAFNANPEPITIANISEGRYIDVNGSFLRVTGYRREEVVGRTSLELTFWGRPEDRATLVEKLKEQGSVRDMEITFHTKAGEERSALHSAEIIEVGGQKCILSILRDTTEQKSLEKQLRQAQKMEAVGQLSGGIAHDFNNLLGVIIGHSEILEQRLPPNDPLHKKCEQIKKAGESAAALTRQLLAFSRQQVLEPKVLDLNAIVMYVGKMLQRIIREDIELSMVLDPLLGNMRSDQSQIEQVILNLVVNARDAMPQGGKLRIQTANVNLDESYARLHRPQLPGPYVMLSVSDTGTGMDAETQGRIFEPFFTTKEVGKGTGLGLSTVYGVVRQSGGHIWVYSELGNGTTFKVYFPRIEETPHVEKPSAALDGSLHGEETILLVEDEEALRELTRDLLTESGYVVLEAQRPDEAVQIAKQHSAPIQLLLTDMIMPGMNGRELAERLSTFRPEIKVVYMSGYTGFTHSGLQDLEGLLLAKPFTRDALLRKIHAVLDRNVLTAEKIDLSSRPLT